MRISWSFIACGGKGGGVTIAVGESTMASDETSGEADSVGVSVGAVVGEEVGSGEGDSVGSGEGDSVGAGV